MHKFGVGVVVDCFRLGILESIEAAAKCGVDSVQITGVREDFDFHTPAREKEAVKKLLKEKGLVLTALCVDIGGFSTTDDLSERIERTKRGMDFALEMGCNIVTSHIGLVPESKNELWHALHNNLSKICEYGNSIGVTFAIETGPEKASCLKKLLDEIPGIGVNLDPANLVMVAGDDPVEAVYTLKEYIVHTHAKDGIMLEQVNPEIVYGAAYGTPENIAEWKKFIEVPLGEGDVEFSDWLKALEDIEFKGSLTIEREVGENPFDDIKAAVEFLRRIGKST